MNRHQKLLLMWAGASYHRDEKINVPAINEGRENDGKLYQFRLYRND